MQMNYPRYTKTIRDLPDGPVYALFGDDDYVIGLTADAICNRISKNNPAGGVERHRFYADSTAAKDALVPAENMGFFSSVAVVIIHDVDKYGSDDAARIISYLNRPSPGATLILTAKSVDKRKSLYKQLKKAQAVVLEFKATREDEMAGWIKAIASQKGKTIGPDAIESLVRSVGANLGTAAMEVKKLVSYVGNETSIEPCHVEELVGRSRVDSAYDLSDAIARRDTSRALSILGNLIDEGESEIGIVALLRWQFLRILRGKDLQAQGIPREKIPSAVGINYFQGEFLSVLERYDYPSARTAYLALFDSDVSLRGKMLKKKYILENLVVTLCNA